jgi:rhomboid family GlyGly-CTERM serine protease
MFPAKNLLFAVQRMEIGMRSIDRLKRHAAGFIDLAVFVLMLILVNLPLLSGGFRESLVFMPERVRMGEWWRVPLHPFVHLSWYHFLLDAGTFLLLYNGLDERSFLRRIGYVAVCGLGSLLLPALAFPVVQTQGLCGLSGVAHGLTAISAIESIKREPQNRRGLLCFGAISFELLAIKSILEVLLGHVLLEPLHFGLVGLPTPASHAGGVLSGALVALMLGAGAGSGNVSGQGNRARAAAPTGRVVLPAA